MIELNFSNALLDIDNMLVFNKELKEEDTIKIDSSSILFNNIVTDNNLLANYSLICFGEIKANKVIVQNNLISYGNITCNELEVYGEFKCYGNLDVRKIFIVKDSIVSGGMIEGGVFEKNLIITGTMEVADSLEVKGNTICNESIFGDGLIICDSITANDFIEIKVKGSSDEGNLNENEKSTQANFDILKEVQETKNMLEFVNSEHYIESMEKLNSIVRVLREKISEAEEMFEYEDISKILLAFAKLLPTFKVDYKIFEDLLHMSELSYIDDLSLFLKLVDYKRRVSPHILKISICDEMLNNFLVHEKSKLHDMKVDNIKTHLDFVKALSLAENNKLFFSEDEYFKVLDKIYSRIGIRSNMIKKLIE